MEQPFVDEVAEPNPELNQVTNSVIGAAIELHSELGPGWSEAVYQRAMEIELELRGITFERQVAVHLKYKGQDVGRGRLDLLIQGKIILELKAADSILPIARRQLISYLHAPGLKLGPIINFNVPQLREGIRRIAN